MGELSKVALPAEKKKADLEEVGLNSKLYRNLEGDLRQKDCPLMQYSPGKINNCYWAVT